MARFKYDGTWSLGQPENNRDLEKFFTIFNDVYFNGVLTGYCQIDLLSVWSLRGRFGTRPPLGFCQPIRPGNETDPRFKFEILSVHIVVSDHWKQKPATERIQSYLWILLHEMIHAIFFIFKCGCDYGCSQKTLGGYRDVRLPGYHNIRWQAVAYAIEEADSGGPGSLGLNLKLKRERSFAWDVQQGGFNPPNYVVLRSLGLDIHEILQDIKWMRPSQPSERWTDRGPLLATNKCLRNDWICADWNSDAL